MTLLRMDNVLIVVEDMETMIGFFEEIGLVLEGRMPAEGPWVDGVIGIDGARSEIAMLRPPDGHGGVELTKYFQPAAIRPEPTPAPVNTLGLRRIMFAVDDLDDVLARVQARGATLVRDVVQYGDVYRLCFVRGPEDIIVDLAQPLGGESGT